MPTASCPAFPKFDLLDEPIRIMLYKIINRILLNSRLVCNKILVGS